MNNYQRPGAEMRAPPIEWYIEVQDAQQLGLIEAVL
jgi:hypothetical protein